MTKTNFFPEDEVLLRAVHTGHDTVVDLIDFMGSNTEIIMDTTERLILLGYLERCAERYIDYLKFRLTNKGREALPKMTEQEQVLADKFGISIEAYIALKEAHKLGRKDNFNYNIADNTGLRPLLVVTCADALERKGYVKMVGSLRRFLEITPKGEELLKEIG